MIQLEHIDYDYQEIPALRDITYTFEMGKCYCLEGPNGCGKSTLFRILNGLAFPTNGRYLLDGEAITEKRLRDDAFAKAFHARIGYVFQNSEVQLFCKNVEDEIAFGLFQLGLPEDAIQERVEKYINLLNLAPLRKRTPYNLSGGEKKRVALGAVLAMDPPILMLDEPLSGLDEDGQQWITDFIASLKSTGKLIIISTHNRELAERLADVHVRMDKSHRIICPQNP
jgi:cobalt/nickel transport system ATP-binding protein